MAQANDRWVDDNYKVLIDVDDRLVPNSRPEYWTPRITALMPEDGISIETSASYSAPLSLGADAISKTSQATLGQALHVEEMGKNFWESSEPSSMSLSLSFLTFSDPWDDVVKPSLTLLSLPLPAKSSETFVRPPIVVNSEGNLGEGVQVDIGPLGKLNVLPESASVNFSGTLCERFNGETWPVASEVDFSFKIAQKPTKGSVGSKLLGSG